MVGVAHPNPQALGPGELRREDRHAAEDDEDTGPRHAGQREEEPEHEQRDAGHDPAGANGVPNEHPPIVAIDGAASTPGIVRSVRSVLYGGLA